jgi:hypothetical protein
VKLARKGVPAVALVTTEFWAQGDFVARSVGMPDVPRVALPHPVAATGVENLRRVADQVREAIAVALRGGAQPGRDHHEAAGRPAGNGAGNGGGTR